MFFIAELEQNGDGVIRRSGIEKMRTAAPNLLTSSDYVDLYVTMNTNDGTIQVATRNGVDVVLWDNVNLIMDPIIDVNYILVQKYNDDGIGNPHTASWEFCEGGR